MGTTVDAIIEAAIRRGELDNLPGKGKPLKLRDDSGVHPEDRMAYHILDNAGLVPPEVETHKRIASLRDELGELNDPGERRALAKKISELEAVHNLKMERARRR
jgi:hypothetical protein